MNKKIIAGNWKMNPTSQKEAREIYQGIKKNTSILRKTQAIVFPPVIYLSDLTKIGTGKNLILGSQDLFWEESGAYTGEISYAMLKNIGVEYVLIGHSERRAMGDTGEILKAKMQVALKNGFKVIFCIGEKVRDTHGKYLSILEGQLSEVLEKIPPKYISQLVIAYEPVWAIGKDAQGVETPDGFFQNTIFIRKILSKLVNKKRALEIPVLYGGSVNVKNAESFLVEGHADGLLVGRDSLSAKSFSEILKIAEKVK